MIVKTILRIILLTAVINCCFSITPATSQTIKKTEIKPQNSSVIEQPIRVISFATREIVKEGEVIPIKVWVESDIMDSATVTLFFAQENMELKEQNPQLVSLPMNYPVSFTLTNVKEGKYNIYIQISGKNKRTNKTITANQQIKDLEVKSSEQVIVKLFSHPLSGVVIGTLLTYLTTSLSDLRGQRKEERQRKQWIVANLPAQLEANRQAVLKRQKAESESWMSKLLTEGYYSEIQRLEKTKPDEVDLGETLLKVGFDLREYEDKRSNNRLSEKDKEELEKRLKDTIEKIGALGS
jgi:hypothetical protein